MPTTTTAPDQATTSTVDARAGSHRLAIYDPAQCCATGACSPDADDELAQFASTLEWLKQKGVTVSRHNLGHDPAAFASNPTVKAALQTDGVACLPLLVADGEVFSRGRYPSRGELASRFGLSASGMKVIAVASASCCAPSSASSADGGCCS